MIAENKIQKTFQLISIKSTGQE